MLKVLLKITIDDEEKERVREKEQREICDSSQEYDVSDFVRYTTNSLLLRVLLFGSKKFPIYRKNCCPSCILRG